MDVVFGLIPMMLLFGFLVVLVFIWMAKNGHFDDLDGAANSIFMDDDFDDDVTQKADTDKSTASQSDQNTAEAQSSSEAAADIQEPVSEPKKTPH